MKSIFKRKFRDEDYNSNVAAILVATFAVFTVITVTLLSIAFIDWSMSNGLLRAILILVTFLIIIGWVMTEPDDE